MKQNKVLLLEIKFERDQFDFHFEIRKIRTLKSKIFFFWEGNHLKLKSLEKKHGNVMTSMKCKTKTKMIFKKSCEILDWYFVVGKKTKNVKQRLEGKKKCLKQTNTKKQ